MRFIPCMTIVSFFTLIACGCEDAPCNMSEAFGDMPASCPIRFTSNITSYCSGEGYVVTPQGIMVDDSNIPIDFDKLDALTRELAECLGMTIDPSCVRVKIAPDWFGAPCENIRGNQIFPCHLGSVSEETRRRRGACERTEYFNPDLFYCAGTVQDGHVVVVTPDLSAYSHELIHVVTGIADHNDPVFQCE